MDTITDIHEELRTSPVIEPHWLKIPASVIYSSLSRSKLYELIEDGEVRSVCLRDKDKVRGVQAYIAAQPGISIWPNSKTSRANRFGAQRRKSKKERQAEAPDKGRRGQLPK